MTSAQFFSGQTQTASYTYDADGRRVKRNHGSGDVWQVYGVSGELLAEYAANASPSQPSKEYGYRAGELLVVAEPAAPAAPGVKLPAAAVDASLAWGSFTPEKATDGNPTTPWIAGGGAPQWLLLDLGQASSVTKVRLLVNQDPPGNTTHEVWAGPSPGSLTLLGTKSGFTQTGQWLDVPAASAGVRYVKVLTSSSPSWVAWGEIEVYGGAAAPEPPTNGLVTHWKLDENAGATAADASASNYTGTLTGGPTWTLGKVGASALNFDGADDRVTTSGASAVPNNFTISFWANPEAVHEIDPEMTFSTYGASGQRYAWWPTWQSGGDAGAGVSVGTNGVSVYEHAPFVVAPMLVHQTQITGWTHVVVVYENKQPKLYLNGVLVRTGLQSTRDTVWAVPQDMGGNVYGFYDGSLDDVRLYNRSLSAAEVSQLAGAGGTGATAPAASPVRWIVSDQLGTPRMVLDKTGSLAGMSRHDYLPFGETLGVGVSSRETQWGYGADDKVRQKFASNERDEETGLDFMQARYYGSPQGRFTSTDPLYYRVVMAVDPQQFNLYGYARNNPLKFTDPTGEALYLTGNTDWLIEFVLYRMAGGRSMFDQFFEIMNGQVQLKAGVDTSKANEGVKELLYMVQDIYNHVYFAGGDSNEDAEQAASLFKGAKDRKGDITASGIGYMEKFLYGGYLVGTRGRESTAQPASLPNGDPVFAVIAYNTDVTFKQGGVDEGALSYADRATQESGLNQPIDPVNIFIHEGAENRAFARMAPGRRNTSEGYRTAHGYAQVRERKIRQDLKITGGFAGGAPLTKVIKE